MPERHDDRPVLEPSALAARSFGTSFRGFDTDEVRAYLRGLGEALGDLLDEQAALRRRAADLEARAAEPQELDEDRLTTLLGEETARVLGTARQSANEIRAKAEASVARTIREATDEAAAARRAADDYAAEVRAAADELRRRAVEEVDAARSEAEAEALALRTAAEDVARATREAAEAAAAMVVERAEREATERVAEAEAEAERTRVETAGLVDERRAEAEVVAAAVLAEVAERRAEADAESDAVVEAAKEHGRELVLEAQRVRERVLKDLSRRRKAGRRQLEQLRAARERLLDAYDVVRRTVDEATGELLVVLPEARVAAQDAGRRADGEDEATVDQLEAEIEAARHLGLPVVGPDAEPVSEETDDLDATLGLDTPGEDDALDAGPVAPEVLDAPTDELVVVVVDAPLAGQASPGDDEDVPVEPEPEVVAEPEAELEVEVEVVAEAEVGAEAEPEAVGPEPEVVAEVEPEPEPEIAAEVEPEPEAVEPEPEVVAEVEPEPEPEIAAEVEPEVVAEVVAEVEPEPEPEIAAEVEPEPEPEPEIVAEVEPEPEPERDLHLEHEAADAPADEALPVAAERVDALFAQLRAQREQSVERAEEVLAAPGSSPVEAGGGGAATDAVTVVDLTLGETETETETGSEPVAAGWVTQLERRDAATEAVEQHLARRLKRALADEQNEVLDTLRRTRGVPRPDDVLPGAGDHAASYAAVAMADLGEAALSGASFAGSTDLGPVEVADLAEALGADLAGQLRPRLLRCFDDLGDDPDELTSRVRAAYREWKTRRIVEITRHHVLAAFSRGQFDALPEGCSLRWVVDDSGPNCPDAEDNALAGILAKGEAFPTGHRLPPAHPGCRCLVVTVAAERAAAP